MTQPIEPNAKAAAITAANSLIKTMDTLTVEIKEVRKTNRKHQFLIRLLGLSMAFDLLLSIALGGIGFTAHNAAEAAARNQKQFCEGSNETRRVQKDLWSYVLNIPASNTSPAQEEQRQKFKDYIDTVFAPRDCK